MLWKWIPSLIALSVVSMSASSGGREQIVQLSEKDAGSTVTLDQGAIMEIVLATNPATGYSWQPTTIDPLILKYLGVRFTGGRATLGAGGMAALRFQALRSGRSELELRYYRHPFEPATSASVSFRLTVLVKP